MLAAGEAVFDGVAAGALDEGDAGGTGGVYLGEVEGAVVGEIGGEIGGGLLLWVGFRRGGRMGFVVLFELAVFALEAAFGGSFVAQQAIVGFDLVGRPVIGSVVGAVELEIAVIALAADTGPLGLGGFEDEIVFEGVFGGVVAAGPFAEKVEPVVFGFAGEDESFGAGAVFDGV